MWQYLAIQGLLFFLFFQPDLVAIRAARIVLVFIALFAVVVTALYTPLDPFAWLLYSIGILLTYVMAQKALRWVSVNRRNLREELSKIEDRSRALGADIAERNSQLARLQEEIGRVSQTYDKTKSMSRSLEFIDVFVDFSEAVLENFALKKTRLILLQHRSRQKLAIDRVYQLDRRHLEFTSQEKSMLSNDVIFRGEVFPFDLRMVESMEKNPQAWTIWTGAEARAFTRVKIPSEIQSFVAIPVRTEEGLAAVLVLEGAQKKDYAGMQILVDRFLSEFRRIKLYADVQRLAITDWLTGVYVRRHFFKRLEEEISRSQRFNLKFSFLMLDLDDFKAANDQYGHQVGDAILKQTAAMIKKTVREVDLVGRYGGEEFAAILLDTDESTAMSVSERMRKNIERKRFKVYDLELRITASIGFATYTSDLREPREIVEWADSALYQAKRQGKNRVCGYIK